MLDCCDVVYGLFVQVKDEGIPPQTVNIPIDIHVIPNGNHGYTTAGPRGHPKGTHLLDIYIQYQILTHLSPSLPIPYLPTLAQYFSSMYIYNTSFSPTYLQYLFNLPTYLPNLPIHLPTVPIIIIYLSIYLLYLYNLPSLSLRGVRSHAHTSAHA